MHVNPHELAKPKKISENSSPLKIKDSNYHKK